MHKADYNSVSVRTRYRLSRQLQRLQHSLKLTQPPAPPAQEEMAQASSTPTPRPSEYGSGVFGRWIIDNEKLPAYRYELNQFEDDRAKYRVSTGAFRRTHWHQIGNERITALASNDGTVQVFLGDQGVMFLNHFNHGPLVSWLGVAWEIIMILLLAIPRAVASIFSHKPEPGVIARFLTAIGAPGAYRRDDLRHAYAGGFGYIYDGNTTWSTAYRFHPTLRDKSERIFGMGYFKTACQKNNIHVKRTVYAPVGNLPTLIVDVVLKNTGKESKKISYYEYWDINIMQVREQLLRSGLFGVTGDAERRKINRLFTPCIVWDPNANALRFHLHPPDAAPGPEIPDAINWQPPDIFLADLSGTPDGKYVDKEKFFGAGGVENPDGIKDLGDSGIPRISGTIMPYCMVLRRDVEIAAGDSLRLRFAYGTVEPQDDFDCADQYPKGIAPVPMPQHWLQQYQKEFHINNANFDPFTHMQADWKDKLAYFAIDDKPHLQREMAWHSYYLLSSVLYNQYFEKRVVPQGSAYLYLHGIDGVPRDFSLYVLPLVYLNPGLAREVLSLIMNMTYGDSGQIGYSYTGNGILTGVIIHSIPSDLDLFFLLALTEYIAATGDTAFLRESVPFYTARNQPEDISVLNHIKVAFRHLLDDVGLGDNNLLRVCDGDWSDDVVIKNVFPFHLLTSPFKTIEHGESVLNSQMALYILPRIAKLLAAQTEPDIHTLGEEMLEEIDPIISQLKSGIRECWNDEFYARAILRYWWNGKRVLHQDKLDLEAQVWMLINDADPDSRETLKNTIHEKLDAPSPIGATLNNGSVWPAISQLLTWGYIRHYPQLAWESFLRQTMANRAETYGHRWTNIWSGPDGVNGAKMFEPGGTYESPPATPMTDFPVMNNNQHAMALLALLRVCGIEPLETGNGLRITPQVPAEYSLNMPLLKLEVGSEVIKGKYRAHNTGICTLQVRIAASSDKLLVRINNDDTNEYIRNDDGYVEFTLPPFKAGDVISFEVKSV